MFDLRNCKDDDLVRMREELTKTRANPLEQLAVIFGLAAKLEVDRELDMRRAAANKTAGPAAPAKDK